MTKMIFIAALLVVGGFITKQAFKLGALSKEKKEERYNESLDRMIEKIKSEIARLESESPAEIERYEAQIKAKKEELERVQNLKNKFTNN
jgi:coenzyme F420-reducing hydrogenase delta subunit